MCFSSALASATALCTATLNSGSACAPPVSQGAPLSHSGKSTARVRLVPVSERFQNLLPLPFFCCWFFFFPPLQTKDVGPKMTDLLADLFGFFLSFFFFFFSIKISKILQRNTEAHRSRSVDLTRENFIRVLMQHHQPTGLNESCRITTVLSNSQSSLSYSSRRFYSCKLSLTSSAGQLNPLLDKTTMHFILRTQPPESGYVSLSVSHLVFNIASGVMNFRRNP